MVAIKKRIMYHKSLYYAILLVVFGVLGYVFLDSGFNTKTRVNVDYEDSSSVYYKVHYLNISDVVNSDRYISSMVDTIDISYSYDNVISQYINGYYRYRVDARLIAYEEDSSESLWERDYNLVDEKTVVIDQNNVNNISIDDVVNVEYFKYRDEIYQFMDEFKVDLAGYLEIKIKILEMLNFKGLDNEYEDNKVITIDIPLTDETFKINADNIESTNSCYEFTSDKAMNIVFLLIGAFCISVAIALLLLVIRQFGLIYKAQNEYSKKLNKLLSKYDSSIVKIKRFYVSKKYNMIYVDSFDELMDVYNKNNKLISFKETKRGSESIFVIIDENNAWIYKLVSDCAK